MKRLAAIVAIRLSCLVGIPRSCQVRPGGRAQLIARIGLTRDRLRWWVDERGRGAGRSPPDEPGPDAFRRRARDQAGPGRLPRRPAGADPARTPWTTVVGDPGAP